jgi:Flp pilus assembly protein TadG
MPVLSAARHHIAGTARRFARANGGNIAVIFAFALLPILAFIGAAIDYSRANKAHASMQAAADSAALMVSKDLSSGLISTADIKAKAQDYFNALYTDKEAQVLTFDATYTAVNGTMGSTVQLTSTGQIQTDFLKVVNFPTLDFGANSTAAWGQARLRVAMALDNTGSMKDDGKMTALQNAAAGTNGLIDQLSKLSKTDGDVYISIIPFAKDVNVGSGNVQSWLDWTDWLNPPTQQPNNGTKQAKLPNNWHAVGPGAVCPFTTTSGGFVCTTGPVNGSATATTNNKNVIPSSGTYSGYICPSVDSNSRAFYNGCWDSEPAGTGAFCSGDSSCACPTNSNGNNVAGCSCSGNGANKSCTGNLYVHNWTQPGPTDQTHNKDQPRVGAFIGFANNKWTATNSTPTVRNAWNQASTNPISTWTGCVADRTNPNDATGVLPSSDVTTQFPANQYSESGASCANGASLQLEPVIPLSSNWSALKGAINTMRPTGGTNQVIGLAWAWQSLLPGGPLNVPAEDTNHTYNRAIIILSDGLNTEDRWPDNGNGKTQNGTAIDDRQEALCANLKALKDPKTNGPMYTVYTIHLNTSKPADPESKVLKDCASSPDKFYSLYNSKDVVSAFNSIGTDLSKLRVAR